MLHQLTYISTARSTLILTDVEQILQTSRRNNERAQVTGLLIFDGKRFLQALEGPLEAVETTFAYIAVDARHRALVRLSSRYSDIREFGIGRWARISSDRSWAKATSLIMSMP